MHNGCMRVIARVPCRARLEAHAKSAHFAFVVVRFKTPKLSSKSYPFPQANRSIGYSAHQSNNIKL